MKWEGRWNKFQIEYAKDAIFRNKHDSFFWEVEKHKTCTSELASEIETVLWDRWPVCWKILNRIGNKINSDKQRRWLYQMISFNHQCLTHILSTNWAINKEMLRSWKKLWEEIKNIAGFIKPKSKNELNDNLDNDNFVKTFRNFSLSKLKSHNSLEAIEKVIQNKEILTTKEEYLDKLLPYLSTDLDFIEQYFSFFTKFQEIQEEISDYEQTELEEVDGELLFLFKEISETIWKSEKSRAYKKLFSKITNKSDSNVYSCLKDIEEFQKSYEVLQKTNKLNTVKKYSILSELVHIVQWIDTGLKQGKLIFLEFKSKKAEKDNPLIQKLENILLQLDTHTRELHSLTTTPDSSYIQEAIDFIINTTIQYSTIMKRLIEQSTLSEMHNY